MTMFEGIVAACMVAMAFVKVYDWVEYQLELHARMREDANGG